MHLPASLLLPMGRFGPAFLAYENFQIYLKWNQSLNYCITAAHLAARLGGAPPFGRGNAQVPEWSLQQMKELQQLLARRGFTVGEIDGKLGAGDARGRQGRADEARAAGRFLSHARSWWSGCAGRGNSSRERFQKKYPRHAGCPGSHST